MTPLAGTVHEVLEGLDEHQQEAATAPLLPLAVIAGPGSGKTKTVVGRISHLVTTGETTASQVLALTHTTKAAGELRERLQHAGVSAATCSTVHAAAWRQLRSLWREAGMATEPQLVASNWMMVKDAVAKTMGRAKADTGTISDAANEIEWGRAWLLDPSQYAAHATLHGRTSSVEGADLQRVWEAFNEAKQNSGVLDFGDVLEVAARMMDDPNIAARVRAKWGVFFLDEYQDIDNAQQRLVDAWIGDRVAVTATGDPEQAIFGFKGGDPSLLMGFAKKWPQAKVVHLTNNYRSSPEIVDWVNALTLVPRPKLVGCKPSGSKPLVLSSSDEREEERQLVQQIQEWRRGGVPLEQIAVLYRFNATSARIEAALGGAGIPYFTAGQVKFFDRQEVRNVLVPFGQLARTNPDANGAAVLLQAASQAGWSQDQPPNGAGAARQRWEAVAALISLVADSMSSLSSAELLTTLQQRAKDAHDVPMSGVTVATIHAAKGLEWDAVWVIGAVEGQIPSAYATTKPQLDEEQHLLYVAVSRARRKLVVSWSQRRQNNWRADRSRFLNVLAPNPVKRAVARTGAGGSKRGAKLAPSVATNPAIEALFQCRGCGGRLMGAPARIAKRCSAGCLIGDERANYDTLAVWRTEAALQLNVAESEVAPERALFAAAVEGSSAGVRGFNAKAGSPPL